ncbi:probable cytochrome P450 CYP44 isoform X1 [Branchiostoma lanceolatum]|uniref:probable cytochrome P450 CYP44 isoform X1 n=1 Tax=Branchiostoma lanceolatum TaxID=7740 RepID=UPI0034545757
MSHILKIVGRREAVTQARLPNWTIWKTCLGQNGRRGASTATSTKQTAQDRPVRRFDEIPGPKGLPFIGTALDYSPFGRFPIKTKMANSTIERYKKYGKIYRENLGPREMVFVCDPKDIETVFRNDGQYPERPVSDFIVTYRQLKKKPIGLAQLNGEEWFRVRSSVNKDLMRPKAVGAYVVLQDDVSRELVGLIRGVVQKGETAGQVPDFTKLLYKWSLESLSLVVLGKRIGCLTLDQLPEDSDAQRMIGAVNDFFIGFAKLLMSPPLYKYISTPTWKRFERAMDTITSVAEKMIGEKLKELRQMEQPPEEADFLTSLLSREDMTLDEAIQMAVDLLNGAVDTTAHTLVFNLFLLAKNPDAQRKLYEEIMEVVPPGQPIDDRVLNKMHYLRAVVKETSRIYPTVLNTARILTRDVVLSGYHVPAKTTVLLAQNVISTLPEYYPEPESFMPERWLRTGSSNVQSFSLLPFGYGPRMCVGRRFAEQELYLGLVRIIQNFHVGWEGDDMKQVWRLVNAPDRDTFIFKERET